MITARLVLILLAFLLLALKAAGVSHPKYDFTAAGLALFVLSFVVTI